MNLAQMERQATLLSRETLRLSEEELARLPASVEEYLSKSREMGAAGPKFAYGPFRQMVDGAICLINQTAITGTAEVALFPVAQFSGWAANQLRVGQKWHLTAWGIMTTAGSSQGNLTITPRYGTSTSGVSLGASAATALVASASNVPWRLEYDFEIRSLGLAGANSKAVGNGFFLTTPAAIAAATGQPVLFGSTGDQSIDTSIAAGLFIGITMGSASDTMTTMSVSLESLN